MKESFCRFAHKEIIIDKDRTITNLRKPKADRKRYRSFKIFNIKSFAIFLTDLLKHRILYTYLLKHRILIIMIFAYFKGQENDSTLT